MRRTMPYASRYLAPPGSIPVAHGVVVLFGVRGWPCHSPLDSLTPTSPNNYLRDRDIS